VRYQTAPVPFAADVANTSEIRGFRRGRRGTRQRAAAHATRRGRQNRPPARSTARGRPAGRGGKSPGGTAGCRQWFAIGIFLRMETALVSEYHRLCRDPAMRQPLAYLRLRQAIRIVVQHGDIEPGHTLPSERDLSRALKLSRVTVRKAIAGLVEEGLLVQRHGAGTFVAERIVKPMSRLTSFTEDLRARGLNPRSEFFERSLGEVTPEESMALNLSPGAQVIRLHRLRYAEDEPLAIERTVVPAAVLPDPQLVHDSLYEALERVDCRPRRALQRLRAVLLGAQQARLLRVPAGSAGLNIERRSFIDDGRVVEFTSSWYRGDIYDFVAELQSD
jgi:GntR family transcriptional regulator